MGLSARRKKKRWRNLLIGGVASAVLVYAGLQLSGVGGPDTGIGGAGPDQTSDASRVAAPWNRWGADDATAIQTLDGTP